MDSVDEKSLFLSVFTLGEIRKGIAGLVVASKRRTQLETWLDVEIRERFVGRSLPVDDAVADRWGILTAENEAQGNAVACDRCHTGSDRPTAQSHDRVAQCE